MQPQLDFSAVATPEADGEVLLQPEPSSFGRLVESNRALLRSYRFGVLDADVQAVRRALRSELCGDPERPLVVTGHQPEFIHPGVWAKHVVTWRLAEVVGGRAVNLVVDNDAPKKTSFTVPLIRDGGLSVVEVWFGRLRAGQAFEQLAALGSEQLEEMRQAVRKALVDRFEGTLMAEYFRAAEAVREPRDFVEQMIAGRRAIDSAFGIDLLEQRVSRVWGGAMLAMMIRDAERFAACYNAALADYRRRLGIKGTRRPVPDLACSADRVELPVWAYGPDEPRQRLLVGRAGQSITLEAGSRVIGRLAAGDLERIETAGPALREATNRALRPRALSLTLWARLLLGDVFIHGIGGAKYDRITDDLIRRYFGVEPPGMICASATLRLPLQRFEVSRGDLLAAIHRQRDLRFNPQRYLGNDGAVRELVGQKRQAIGESARLREQDRYNHAARRGVFEHIRRLNEQMLSLAPELAEQFARQVGQVRQQLAENVLANSREYFVGLHSRERLAELAERIRRCVGC